MKEKNFEIPQPTEKLSYKFILDSLKEDQQKEAVSQTQEEVCGKAAPPPTVDEQFQEVKVEIKSSSLPEGKKYFRIGEASEYVGVEPYVLRYWETEFRSVKPVKSNTGHRVYSRKDVETLAQIKHLLHEEKFSIKGAKKKLQELKAEAKLQAAQPPPEKKVLKALQQELKELLALAKQTI